MKLPTDQTIAALATPPGAGALAVIRLSGSDAFAIAERCFSPKGKSRTLKPFRVHYGYIKTGTEDFIDDVLVTAFKAPKSYTGEDTVEISCHGNPLIVSAILNTLLLNGARDAEPGEFTKRAYLNGRLDLSQAEAVAEIINARSQSALRGGRNQLDGLLSAKVHELRTKLVNASSLVELELDFAEEDVEFIDNSGLIRLIQEIIDDISALLATYSFGRVMREGVNVALVGMPNVGKSSLLNYLLKESRAIVSEIAGTTRDVIREEMIIDGFLFRLYDTAGIRPTDDVIEKEGVARSRETIRSADLVLFMNDINLGLNQELFAELLQLTTEDKIITVFNKADIYHGTLSDIVLALSAKTGQGMDNLLKTLREKAIGGSVYTEKTVIITTQRHYNALTKAKEQLEFALGSVRSRMSGEFISVDLRNASDSLGEIIGDVTEDDILNNIFSKFCIGK
ncbi:MAG: tRNA uridine-5-carboxymethylaminomethyl(34) synthesis GTPase MnmE [Ignavibacteriales bacterium]|nr:MAG: tRNA uridine-5-carboxymethylaminomethyl(34) synthesis GTPase MnmE [Ignavibacteriales bacterium]